MRISTPLLCSALLFVSDVALSSPLQVDSSSPLQLTENPQPSAFDERTPKVPLRILPLGASIVYGWWAANLTGFRKPLRDHLRFNGYDVNMVGSLKSGTSFNDNDVEAWPGAIIDGVRQNSTRSYKYFPNVVLINAGTNDCARNINVSTAHLRMKTLIEDLWTNVGKETTIVLSSILNSNSTVIAANAAIVNANYRQLVQDLQSEHRRVVFADMSWIPVTDLVDGVHPQDPGFAKMAATWWASIKQAERERKLVSPKKMTFSAEEDHTGDDGPLFDPKLPVAPAAAKDPYAKPWSKDRCKK